MKCIVDLSITSAPSRPRKHWNPEDLFQSIGQGALFDPSDKTTLFQDLGGTVPVASDGDAVALMVDKSGNGNHVAQSGPASRPSWRTDGRHGWLEFDGVDDFLVSASLDFSGTDKIGVFAGVSGVVANSNTAIATYGDGLSPRGFVLFAVASSADTTRFRSGEVAGSASDIEAPRPDPAVYSGLADLSVSRNTLRTNGQPHVGLAFSSPMTDFESDLLYVGARSTGSFLQGNFHGLVLLGDFPNAAEIGMLEKHLARKTGVSL